MRNRINPQPPHPPQGFVKLSPWAILTHNYLTTPKVCFHCQKPYKDKIITNNDTMVQTMFRYPCGCVGATATTHGGTTVAITTPGTLEEFQSLKKKYDAKVEGE